MRESGGFRGGTVISWKEKLMEIVSSYAPQDVWNLDESGLSWRALSEKDLVYYIPCALFISLNVIFFTSRRPRTRMQDLCLWKKSNHLITVMFNVNAAGGRE